MPSGGPDGAAVLFGAETEALELLVEARDATSAVEQLLRTARPSRMGVRINIELHLVTGLAPCGAGGEFGAIRHDNGDGVVVWMNIGLHDRPSPVRPDRKSCRQTRLHVKAAAYTPARGR